MKKPPFPRLNPTTKYILRCYKERFLKQPCTVDASRIVDCIDVILEVEQEAHRG